MYALNVSDFTVNINYTTLAVCISYILINFRYFTRFLKLEPVFSLLLPSILLPFLVLLAYCIPFTWALFDKEFKLTHFSLEHLDTAVIIAFVSTTLLLIGIIVGRRNLFSQFFSSPVDRSMDLIFFDQLGETITLLLVIADILVFPFAFALKIELIFGSGIRGLVVDNEVLFRLVPFARILLSIFTIISGMIFAYRPNKIILIIPFLDTLQQLLKLSRAFFLPLILFGIASTFAGKKWPKWIYYLAPLGAVIGGSAAIGARKVSGQGLGGISAGFGQVNSDIIDSIRNFFEANAVIGIISTVARFRDDSRNLLDGALAWIQSILPIPTFFELTGSHLSVAALLKVKHAGIPMPALGEIFFQMGWIGLGLFFVFGFFLGKIEGKLIGHTLICGKAYWPNILIWMSLLFCFILSLHSPSRSASRLFVYSVLLIWIVKKFVIPKSPTKLPKHETQIKSAKHHQNRRKRYENYAE